MKRIIVHHTAGGHRASDLDRKHYHLLVEVDGTVVVGTEAIADNIVTSDGDYAAHTRNLNTDSIGIGLCGMRQAVEYPFDAGPSPLTEKQWRAAMALIAETAGEYSIPITRETVLTHAEVEPTLGVKQRGKWDITRLPFRPDLVGALPVGDYMRESVTQIMRATVGLPAARETHPTIRKGDRGAGVRDAQSILAALGFHSGNIDGIFGQRTKSATVAFQADAGLIADGVIGPQTWAAMMTASPRPERVVTEADLRERGSTTIKTADRAETEAKGLAGILATLGGAEVVTEAGGVLDQAEGLLPRAQTLLIDNWPAVVVLIVAGVVWWRGPQIMKTIRAIRTRDAQTGAHMGR